MGSSDAGYAVVDLEDLAWSRHGWAAAWATLSEPLGATETAVDALRLGDDTVELAAESEQLVVALEGALKVGGTETPLTGPGVALLPAGTAGRLRAQGPSTLVVVSAAADPGTDATPVVVDLEAAEYVVPETSDVATAFLTDVLGSTGMKVNARRLEPGQVVPYHTEGDQEELFVPVDGPAGMRLADEAYETPAGTVTRVAPDVPRSAINDGDEPALWVMVGAPPTGEATGWDPGAEILE